jgi:hypothetical protein
MADLKTVQQIIISIQQDTVVRVLLALPQLLDPSSGCAVPYSVCFVTHDRELGAKSHFANQDFQGRFARSRFSTT